MFCCSISGRKKGCDSMIQTYRFFGEEPIEFNDLNTVKELVEYAFERFDYYEPFGMDAVTIYEASYPGHFVLNTSQKCASEIKDPNELCFAYYIPGVLYYAEGGWGHHMRELTNHPKFSHPVDLELKFDDFKHTVVFEGSRTFREILELFQRVGYIEKDSPRITMRVLAYPRPNYSKELDYSDNTLDLPLKEFEKTLPLDEGIVTLIIE